MDSQQPFSTANNLILRQQLLQSKEEVSKRLSMLIEEKYKDFIKLPLDLKNLNVIISEISSLLQITCEHYSRKFKSISELLTATENKLFERSQLDSKIKRINLYQSSKKIYEILRSSSNAFGEKEAVELNHLLFVLTKTSEEIEAEDEDDDEIKLNLSQLLSELSNFQDEVVVSNILTNLSKELNSAPYTDEIKRLFYLLGVLECTFKSEHVFDKFIQNSLDKKSLFSNSSDFKDDVILVVDFIQKVIEFFPSGTKRQEFIVDFVFSPVFNWLNSNVSLQNLFSETLLKPKQFHHLSDNVENLIATCFAFISNDLNAMKKFHESSELVCFKSKLSYSVYYQLIFKETISKLEQCIRSTSNASAINEGATFTVLEIFEFLFSEEVFLVQLAARFFKLFLQVFILFNQHLFESLTSTSNVSNMSSLLKCILVLNSNISSFQTIYKNYDNQFHSAMRQEINYLSNKFESSAVEHVFPTANSDISNSFYMEHLFNKCLEFLKYVPVIVSQYRGTSAGPPSKPSAYVVLVLKPLLDEFGSFSYLSEYKSLHHYQAKQAFTNVLLKIVEKFSSVIGETLTSLRNTEEILKKFQQRKNASSSLGMTDDEKIRKQASLDVESFIVHVESTMDLLEAPSECVVQAIAKLQKLINE